MSESLLQIVGPIRSFSIPAQAQANKQSLKPKPKPKQAQNVTSITSLCTSPNNLSSTQSKDSLLVPNIVKGSKFKLWSTDDHNSAVGNNRQCHQSSNKESRHIVMQNAV